MPINCLIIDDEPASREVLERYIEDTKELNLIKACKNAFEANEELKKDRDIHLLFLDINMPKLNGMDFYKSLINPPLVIFTTAYPEYALDGFEVEAVDYLLKPFPFSRFLKAINKATHQLKNSTQQSIDDFITLKADKKIHRIDHDEIIRLESIGDYVKVFYKDTHILVHDTLQNILNKLPAQIFIRVHKSHVVNFFKLDSAEGNMLHIGTENVPIGATYKSDLIDKLSLK